MGTWHRRAILELGLVLPGCVCEHLAKRASSYSSLVEKRPFRSGFLVLLPGFEGCVCEGEGRGCSPVRCPGPLLPALENRAGLVVPGLALPLQMQGEE